MYETTLCLMTTEWGSGNILLLLLIVAIAVLAPILSRRRTPPLPRLDTLRAEQEKMVRQSADKALVELVETGREISAQIDTKIRVLNTLVKDADTQSRRLESILRQAGIPIETPSQPRGVPTGSRLSHSKEQETPSSQKTVATIAKPTRTPSGRWDSPLHTRIETMHRAGKKAADIARATGLSLQEVNLVLHLLNES